MYLKLLLRHTYGFDVLFTITVRGEYSNLNKRSKKSRAIPFRNISIYTKIRKITIILEVEC